jgi:excisionase family DNA binding protein
MNDEVYADERLENIAAKLAGHGFDVNGPSTDNLLPDEPDTGYIAVCSPVTRQCAEVRVVRHSSNPSDVFLQLSYWTDPGTDPDGSQMAEGVMRLLSGAVWPGYLDQDTGWLTVDQVSRIMRLSRQSIYRLRKQGYFPNARVVGKRTIQIPESDVQEVISADPVRVSESGRPSSAQ